MMCISLFSYGRSVVVRCKGVRLGMGCVGSVIWWVGLGWVDENRPTDNSAPYENVWYRCFSNSNFATLADVRVPF